MNLNEKKLGKAILAVILSVAIFSGCNTANPVDPTATPSAGTGVTGVSTERPTDMDQLSNVYELPTMGMIATLPESLMECMDQGKVSMYTCEIGTEDGSALQYGYLCWMTEGQNDDKNEETGGIDFGGGNNMVCVGTIGVYQVGLVGQLDELTGCDEHKELDLSADGAYKYYLSTSSQADKELTDAISKVQLTVTEMTAYGNGSGNGTQPPAFSGTSVGEFSTQDVNGNPYTQDIFKDYDLTLVNIFTTWCSPCVAEMPDLEKLHQKMADRGVNVVGIVLDVLGENGEIVQKDLERAQLLVEKTGVTYPILLPDATYFNGRLIGIEAFPETFFVDKNGNIVGGTYSGSGSLEDWLSVVEDELANLREGA